MINSIQFYKPSKTQDILDVMIKELNGIPAEYQFYYQVSNIRSKWPMTMWVTANSKEEAEKLLSEKIKVVCSPADDTTYQLTDMKRMIYQSNRESIKG